ncbi:hypothetical protein B0J12DRAFT_762674, partial [Macrophomina phaseolina]
ALVFVLIALNILLLIWLLPPRVDDSFCAKQLSSHSPLLDVVEYTTLMVDVPYREETVYQGEPTPERDQAWKDLFEHEPFLVQEKTLQLLNKTDISYLRTRDGSIQAKPQVFHDLHCLVGFKDSKI